MNINFAGGLVTNEVYNPRSRGVSGQHVRNCRVNDNGWLDPAERACACGSPRSVLLHSGIRGDRHWRRLRPVRCGIRKAGGCRSDPVRAREVGLSSSESGYPRKLNRRFRHGRDLPATRRRSLHPRRLSGEISDPLTIETVKVVAAEAEFGEFEVDPANPAKHLSRPCA